MQLSVVMLNDFFERCEPPIVHVGSGQRHISKRGHFELSAIGFLLRYLHSAKVGRQNLQAVIHESMIREEISPVTVEAICAP